MLPSLADWVLIGLSTFCWLHMGAAMLKTWSAVASEFVAPRSLLFGFRVHVLNFSLNYIQMDFTSKTMMDVFH
jgi:hypothetical protein